MGKIRTFLEMIKFEHTLFALPFAYLGLVLGAKGWPSFYVFFWVTTAMVSFRTMAMGLNRLIDQRVDAENPRTRDRALPAGRIQPAFAWKITLLSFLVFELSAFLLNPLCFKLSWLPVLLACLYPWMKHFTWFSHAVLGIILGMAPYGAWIASRGGFSWIPAALMIGVACWVTGFDILYALQDRDFDTEKGLHSFPVRFGQQVSLSAVLGLHGVAVLAWLAAGWMAGLGWIYAVGLMLVAAFLVRENLLVRSFGLAKLGQAFFTMNAAVSVALFAAVVLDFSLRGLLS